MSTVPTLVLYVFSAARPSAPHSTPHDARCDGPRALSIGRHYVTVVTGLWNPQRPDVTLILLSLYCTPSISSASNRRYHMGKLSKPTASSLVHSVGPTGSRTGRGTGLEVVVQPRGWPGSIVSTVGRGGANVTLSTDGVVLNDDGRPAAVVHQYDRQFSLACDANAMKTKRTRGSGPSCALGRIVPAVVPYVP